MEEIKILTYFVLAVFVGFEVVSKVSSTLHTPLMSGANAIHGIILVGSIIVAGHADTAWMLALALLAVLMATVNLVGGFVVTDDVWCGGEFAFCCPGGVEGKPAPPPFFIEVFTEAPVVGAPHDARGPGELANTFWVSLVGCGDVAQFPGDHVRD